MRSHISRSIGVSLLCAGIAVAVATPSSAQPLDSFVRYPVKRNRAAPKLFKFGPVGFANAMSIVLYKYTIKRADGLQFKGKLAPAPLPPAP